MLRRLPRLPSSRSGADGLRRIDVLDQLDAGALEVAVELLDVALVDVDLGDRGGDLAEGQHADLLTLGQQVLYLFKFLKLSYKHSASSCSVSVSVVSRLRRRAARRGDRSAISGGGMVEHEPRAPGSPSRFPAAVAARSPIHPAEVEFRDGLL